jgi:hypothetical protein
MSALSCSHASDWLPPPAAVHSPDVDPRPRQPLEAVAQVEGGGLDDALEDLAARRLQLEPGDHAAGIIKESAAVP